MGIKAGYKDTELGIIPKDWGVKHLHQICERISVGLATSVTKYYRGSGVPIVRNLNIKDGFFDGSDMLFIDSTFAEANKSKAAKGLDVLVVHTGANLGQTCVLPSELNGCQTFTTLIITPKKQELNPYYLCYHMNSYHGEKEMKRLMVGGGKGNLNTGDLKTYLLAFPNNIMEQSSIATTLSDIDSLITSLGNLINKKQKIKQGTMQQLLTGNKRLLGFNGEWAAKTISEIGQISGSGVDKRIKPEEKLVRLINYLDVYRKNALYSNEFSWVSSAPPQKAEKCSVRKGDIFFTPSSEVPHDIGITAVAMEDIPDAAYSYHVVRLRLHEEISLKFRIYMFKTRFFLTQAESYCEGSGQRYVITLKKFNELKVYYPVEKKEQEAIAQILFDMDSEIEALERKLSKCQLIKQGMMQELLTGRKRLV